MEDNYNLEIRGSGVIYGLLAVSYILVAAILVIIELKYPITHSSSLVLPVALGAIFIMIVILFVYSFTRKRIVIDEYGIRYWFGRWLKFSAYWPEIEKIENGIMGSKHKTSYVFIKTSDNKLLLGSGLHFNQKTLKRIFCTISIIMSGSKTVEINDNLNWYPERKLISRVIESFYKNDLQRFSVTLIM